MGLAQSHAEFFQPHAKHSDGDASDAAIDPLELLYRVERSLWRSQPPWLQPPQPSRHASSSGDAASTNSTGRSTSDIDALGAMSTSQALELVPSLMDEKWVAALVALSDSVDVIIQSTGLALLSRIVRTRTVSRAMPKAAEDVFVKVGGIARLMALLDVESVNVRYLALEVIHALCARNDRMVLAFSQRGLLLHLAKLAALNDADEKDVETTLASLKILRLVLPHQPIREAVGSCRLLPLLLRLAHSSNPNIASVAVVCIGLTLPHPANMAEIIELGCIEALLKLVAPSSTHSYAVVQALSVVADQDVSIFPKELTLLTMTRTLDTLRGGAKRSKTASASAYLFASLSKSPVFRTGLCTEANLSILSKLLVGGSADVLKASVFALGMAAFKGSNATKEILFSVEAPDNLLKLLDIQLGDEELTRLILFALSSILDEAIALSSGCHVDPARVDSCSDSLRLKMRTLCSSMVTVATRRDIVLQYTANAGSSSTTFAAKILCCMCMAEDIKRLLAQDTTRVQQMLSFLDDAGDELLSSLLLFFIECSSTASVTDHRHSDAARFCALVGQLDSRLDVFIRLFASHESLRLLGLPTAFTNFAALSADLRCVLSGAAVIEHVLALSTKVTEPILHRQALTYLDEITRRKNAAAIANIFSQSPDRVANFLHSARVDLVQPTLTVLRRLFKRHNNGEMPSTGARRQLVNMLALEDLSQAIPAVRVWGNLLLHPDKRESYALLPKAVETLLRLIRKCRSDLMNPATRSDSAVKHCRVAVRAMKRGLVECLAMQKETACAPSFLVLFELFSEQDAVIMGTAVEAMIQIAQVPALRRYIVIPSVLETLATLLRERDASRASPVYRIAWLHFVSALCKRDAPVQCMLAEFRVVDAILLLVHSPMAVLDLNVLEACMEALAWLCSADPGVRKQIALSSKILDLALRYVDTPNESLATACLHFLQRVSNIEDGDDVRNKIRLGGGVPIVMRAIGVDASSCRKTERAFAVVRNLVTNMDANKTEFQRLGFNPAVVACVSSDASRDQAKLLIRGLQAITAMCLGTNAVAKRSKQEVLECDHSKELLQLVASRKEPKLCRVWCEATTSLAQSSPHNQRRLVNAHVTAIAVPFVNQKDGSVSALQVAAARLLAYMASLPDNRSDMMTEGKDSLLAAMIIGLQSDVHDLQRYVALLIAHLATRNDENKVHIGAAGTATSLIDRLSSKQLNVVENVLQAVMKLGSHAGNKVKFGSRLCFEKLLALVHHDELAIRKGAVSSIAVLIEGNDANKKFLLQCEASVVTDMCALMKSPNGKIVESAMLILGELSQLPDQILEISKFIDIVVIVRMIEHINARIRRAALHTVLNLTKEAFNKLRFGIQECVDAMLNCLKSEDMLIVELATTCLANLSFTAPNASRIAKKQDSLGTLLKLAAASATSKDYLSWKEARALGLGKERKPPSGSSPRNKLLPSPSKKAAIAATDSEKQPEEDEEREEEEVDDKLEPFVYSSVATDAVKDDQGDNHGDANQQQVLDFSNFPARQTAVLEQTLLVISNCADAYHSENAVEKIAVKVMCQALSHPSELVKRCACYILGVWCKKDATNQRITTKQGILPVLIQLLHSPNSNIVEAAMYALAKLAYYGDNHMKLLQLDLLTTIVHNILRKQANASHEGLMDRTIRLLGTLVQFPRVRQTIKSEEIIADILTQLLQIHRALAKNISRLILGMLEEESLKFFMPKKTVMILRIIFTDEEATAAKTVRNVLRIFERIATVEEHKTTIALEDSGEALTRMVRELRPTPEDTKPLPTLPPNAATVLSLLACASSNRKIATILHDKDVYAVLPLYLVTVEDTDSSSGAGLEQIVETDEQQQARDARKLYASPQMALDLLVLAQNQCKALGDRAGTKLSHADFSRLLVDMLRVLAAPASDGSVVLLPEASLECFCVLERLSAYSRDQQTFAEEYAVEVVHFFTHQWIEATDRDGTVEGRLQGTTGGKPRVVDLVAYVTPLARVIHRMSEHETNKVLFVQVGGIPLLLQCLHVALLTDELRVLLARSLRLLCALPVACEWFDAQDVVTPLFRFMHMHRHHAELLLHCLGCLADVLENSVASRRHVVGQPQILTFLLHCLDNALEDHEDKIHFAINALECLSMEPELASAMAQLEDGLLEVVSKLLLIPIDTIARPTQYFAIEMMGYMASYGFATRLGLQKATISSVIRFVDYENDESVTGESIGLVLWTLAHLVRRRTATSSIDESVALNANVTRWIMETDAGVDKIIHAGLMPSERLGTTTSVTANTLTILLAVCTSGDAAMALIKRLVVQNRKLCTSLAAQLEAVEREVNLPALRLLAICMATISADEYAAVQPTQDGEKRGPEHENWSIVFKHLMEWMEVYARDPAQCPGPSLSDAFICLSHISSIDALAGEFRGCINRSGLAEIVAAAITYLDPSRKRSSEESGDQDADDQRFERRNVLLNALKICGNLMEYTPAYSERFFLLNVPQSIENVLMANDDELIFESLVCMSLLADWSSTRQLLFCSLRCVQRLTQLLHHDDVAILVKITPLLALMCSRIPSLPGLCSSEGINALCVRLARVDDWRGRDKSMTRITEDCATMLLSIFSSDDSIYILYEQADVVGKMFSIVAKHDEVPELPLRVLTKISSCSLSHRRLLQLLPPMCRLLQGTTQQLGGAPQHLVLCMLFNMFCRNDDPEALQATLHAGESTLLPQLLPLARWVGVPNAASIRITLKILQSYVSSPSYNTLFNDGKNVPALLKLVADANDDVSGSATQLLLVVINERDAEIAVTVEDGIAVIVRTLQKTTKSHLQCLLLTVLRNMCHDNEIPVLIMNEDGVGRLVYFIRERKGVFFAADERLALSCKILRYVSAVVTRGAATRIVDARGHVRLIELSTHQETSATKDLERATTLEILANLAASGEVTTPLVDAKLHEHCLKWILAQPPPTSETERASIPPSRKLALSCLRSMCKFSKQARDATACATGQLVELLERWLAADSTSATDSSATAVTCNALAVLMYLSKTLPGRHLIFSRSSTTFVERVCHVILLDLNAAKTEKQAPVAPPSSVAASVLGVKLLGNLLSDLTPERFRVTWVCDSLTQLLTYLQGILIDHQQRTLQLHALNLLSGSFDGAFYFPVSTQMLSDLFNLLLISPTPRHAQQAEHIIIKAFEQEDAIQQAIAGNQILEQFVIVFTQRVESLSLQQHADASQLFQRRPLAPALTHVLNVSIARGFIVHPRFTSKIMTLLCTSPLAVKAETQRKSSSSSSGAGASGCDCAFGDASAWTSENDEEDALTQALAVYLGFVYRTASPSSVATAASAKSPPIVSLQQSIREALQAEANLPALATLVLQLLSIHDQLCPMNASPANATVRNASQMQRHGISGSQELSQRDLLVWNLVTDCLQYGEPLRDHVVSLLREVPHELWLCLLKDMLTSVLGTDANKAPPSISTDASAVVRFPDATAHALGLLSIIATHSPCSTSPDASATRAALCTSCLQSSLVWEASPVMHTALRALTSIRAGWGDDVIVQSCRQFTAAPQLISRWLSLFTEPAQLSIPAASSSEDARIRLLQLLLLLVSSGTWIEELKRADIRGAIENNELIPAAHKSLPITILSLLGYNADLNLEFALALDRFEHASIASSQKKENLSYLVNFLQLYTLTDEELQERAIDCFMRHLVDDITALAHESAHSKSGGDSAEAMLVCIRDYLVCLGKLSHARTFAELYMERWNTNALLNACFSRRRAANSRGFRECAVLSLSQIHDVLNVVSKLCEANSPLTSAGTLSDTTFLNAMTLLDDLGEDQTPLVEQVVAVLAWCIENEDTFDMVCNLSARLRSVLRFVTTLSDAGVRSLLVILDTLTKRVAQIELLGELLTELLTCVYRHASKLSNTVREKLLLYILMVLKQMGEEDLTACSIYEQSIQVILANVHVPTEMTARCSWDLLGVLTEFDAAVITIFNFDGIQIMLKEFCGPTSAAPAPKTLTATQPNPSPVRRVLSTRKSAMSATDRAALAASSAAVSEVTYRRMEALKCLSKAVRNHDEVLQKIGEAPAIGAHLFRVLAGTSNVAGSATDQEASLATMGVAQEHAAHLIARVSSQEFFRASLLSQDHVSTLIESLESVHPKIVLYALETLFYLSEFALCLDALVRHATVPVLAQILVSPLMEENDATQQMTELFVLGLLANMCAKSKIIGRRVVSSNLLPRLRVFLASPRPQIQLYAAWVTKSVSKDSELVAKLHEQRMTDVLGEMLLEYEPIRTQRKVFGALCYMIAGHRPGLAFVSSEGLRDLARVTVRAMHPLVVSSQPGAHRTLTRALTVLEAIASLSQEEKDMLCDDDDGVDTQAIPLVLQLLDSIHSDVKLKALLVMTKWLEDNTDRAKIRLVLLAEAPLLSIVRAISEEQGECLLVALQLLNTLLAIDEELKSKLSAMTNEVLLRLLPTLVPASSTEKPSSHTRSSLNPMQLRALNEALKSLVAMVRTGNTSSVRTSTSNVSAAVSPTMSPDSLSTAVENALEPLVELLRLSMASESLRLNALYLLVNYAGSCMELRPKMLLNGTMVACIRLLKEPHDDKLLQLCLLGMALLTGSGVDFSGVVGELLEVVDVLLSCLTSKNASIQANAVWVVSNICGEERLKAAIGSRGGATTLQAILNETTASDGSMSAQSLSNSGHARPPSSSQRIREYAPKAIRSLGFAPMATSPPPPPATK